MGYIGRAIDMALQQAGEDCKSEADAKYKRDRALSRFLDDGTTKPSRGQFADPAAMRI